MRTSGFTLVEVVMTTVLLSIVVGIMAIVLDFSMQRTREESSAAGFRFLIDRKINTLLSDLSNAHFRTLYREFPNGKKKKGKKGKQGEAKDWKRQKHSPYQGECLEYAKFVEFSPKGKVVWSTSSHLPPDKRVAYYIRFSLDREISETDSNIDLNGDGDRLDVFALGYLEHASGQPGPQGGNIPDMLEWQRFCELPLLYLYTPENPAENPNFPMFQVKKSIAGRAAQADLKFLFYQPEKKMTLWIRVSVTFFNM